MLLTGSAMNGRGHLFGRLWALDPDFELYAPLQPGPLRDALRLPPPVPRRQGDEKPSTRGAVTVRVERKDSKDLGVAPGIQPTAVLRFVLPRAVTLQKRTSNWLPALAPSSAGPSSQLSNPPAALGCSKSSPASVKDDAFQTSPGRSSGTRALRPSCTIRCTADQGNGRRTARGRSAEHTRNVGNALVHRVEPFPASEVLPKEARLADTAADLARDGPSWCSRGTELLPYARLLSEIPGAKGRSPRSGEGRALEASSVDRAPDRQGLQRARHESGVHSNRAQLPDALRRQAWMENPGCNAIVYRQAVGRIDRIGQKRPPVVRFYVYAGTVQIGTHALLLRKAAVSQATDGLDPSAAPGRRGGRRRRDGHPSVGRALLALLEDRAEARRWAAA